ncbi:Dor1-like family-domain-containing protein, partial [Infundibulicybe gibba]
SSPASSEYLDHLTSLPLSSILSEPATLQTQSHHLTSSLTSLTHTSYPTFVSLHKTTTALTSSLSSLASSLSTLLDTSLPALESAAQAWYPRTDNVLAERRRARVVLEQHDKIRDLLDIPVMIDTSVRNGYFAEALSLAAHAKSLASKYSSTKEGPPAVLVSVLAEVRVSEMQMLIALLGTLNEPGRKLPALWKAVNFLKKMEVFGPPPDSCVEEGASNADVAEEQIALAFVSGREGCLKASLEGSGRDIDRLVHLTSAELGEKEKEDIARGLKKYIDLWREGVYDIVTQFSTIFLDPSSSTTVPARIQQTEPNTRSAGTQRNLHNLITTYTTHALETHLLPILQRALPLLSLPLLPPLLTQLTYCATAFARIGADFRLLIGGIIHTAVVRWVSAELAAVAERWSARVGKATREGAAPATWLAVTKTPSAPAGGGQKAEALGPHVPPHVIASYPPLARYTNEVLGVLNTLRMLAPVEVLGELEAVLVAMLGEGTEVLRSYVTEKDEELGHAAMGVFVDVLVPSLKRALVEGVY